MRRTIIIFTLLLGLAILVAFGYWYATVQTNHTPNPMSETQILTLQDCSRYDDMAVCELLHNTGSTTQYFKSICPKDFNVLVLSQRWRAINDAEQSHLHFTHHAKAYVREVLLRCGTTNLMYAQSVFPEATIKATGDTFIELGNHALGEILFQDPSTQRKEWELNLIQPTDSLFINLQNYFQDPQQFLWRRNSLLYYKEHPLLLEEIYLPALLEPLRHKTST